MNPPPPKVGARFRDKRGHLYHVRGIVDYRVVEGEPYYQVVLRTYVRGYWKYEIVGSWAFGAGLYKPGRRRKECVE